jgi:hypothetical protein
VTLKPDLYPGRSVQIDFKKIIKFLYGPIISVIYFFMRSYSLNRQRLNEITAREKISWLLQFVAIGSLIIWLFIFAFASDESRNALTEQVKQRFDSTQPANKK